VLLELLDQRLPRPDHYWIAFSGGLDSSVLLHALAGLRDRLAAPLSAIHIDHRLQARSAEWAVHCRRQCAALGIPLSDIVVDAAPRPGESPEAAARGARYQAIAAALGPRAMLLTAHHRDDQAETLLLQLLRGAGVDGLAAMPLVRAWHDGWHARPLLDLPRAALRAWAVAARLHWIEDPSNAESLADRNYLRHQVIPALRARWPAAAANIAHSAALCGEAADLLLQQTRRDLAATLSVDGRYLRIDLLRRFSPAAARNLVRLWLRTRGVPPLPRRRLHGAIDQLCNARPDAAVCISWSGGELRRFRDQAWLVSGGPGEPPTGLIEWQGEQLALGAGLGVLRRRLMPGGIDTRRWQQGRVQIGFRNAGLRCQPVGRAGSRTFKKIAQQFAIPPWLRDRMPLIYIDGELAAIPNACVCEPYAAAQGQSGWVVEWIHD